MTETIGLEEAKRIFEAIVEEYGYDYQYDYEKFVGSSGDIYIRNTCTYSSQEGKPSCIVGQLLYRTAPNIFEKLHYDEWENYGYNKCVIVSNISVATGIGMENYFTRKAIALMQRVQSMQDAEIPWGTALKDSYEEIKWRFRED